MFGMPWTLTEIHGWGLLGTHTALYLLDRGTPPLLLDKPLLNTMRPEVRDRIATLVPAYERISAVIQANAGKVVKFDDVDIMHGLGNHLFASQSQHLQGRRNIGVIAFEDTTFNAEITARGRQYDFIVTHSLYNKQLLEDAGIPDVRLAWQGVDPAEIKALPRQHVFGDRFVVFSGGKLEYRKGQDIVLEAFKRFHARHPDSVLITAWQNMWPQTALSMADSPLTPVAPQIDAQANRVLIAKWAADNGLPADCFVDLGLLNRAQVAAALTESDVALFPNRCEGATNLVAMEAMAFGLPVILSNNTGHKDLIPEPDVCFALMDQRQIANPHGARTGWCDSSVEEAVAHLETVYSDRAEARRRGAKAREFVLGQRTWRKFAEVFIAECER